MKNLMTLISFPMTLISFPIRIVMGGAGGGLVGYASAPSEHASQFFRSFLAFVLP